MRVSDLSERVIVSAKKILVLTASVDGEAIQQRLTGLGYLVCGVIHSTEVLPAQVMALRPDLIVMDMVFQPSMAGGTSPLSPLTVLDTPVVYRLDPSGPALPFTLNEVVHCVQTSSDDRELQRAISMALHRHDAEAKLRKMERWLAATLNSVGDAVLATDINGLVTFLNPSAESLTGWSALEAVGKPVVEVFRIFRDGNTQVIEDPVARALTEGVTIQLAEGTCLQRKSGTKFPIDDSVAPIRNEQGEVTGVVIIFRDDTKNQQLEERLRETQRLEGIGRLAGGIAHDFNNLLTVINGSSALLHHHMAPGDPQKHNIEMIQQAGSRAALLTHQLLAFSRGQILLPVVLNLNDIVSTMISLLRCLLGEKVEVITLLGKSLALIKADPGQLGQLLMNLAVNAGDAMADGGQLIIETKNVEGDDDNVVEGEANVPPSVRLVIRDTGSGMDTETLKHLYDPFYTTKGVGKGTGLGLSVVYGIIKQSGGRISVASKKDEGTTFTMDFPRSSSTALPEHQFLPIATTEGGSETILVVEDDELVRNMVLAILGMDTYHVLTASNAAEALHLVRSTTERIHLVITDVVMPGINGRELVEQLKTVRSNLKVLLISGYTNGLLGKSGDLESGLDFLPKPFGANTLLIKVRQLLNSPVFLS